MKKKYIRYLLISILMFFLIAIVILLSYISATIHLIKNNDYVINNDYTYSRFYDNYCNEIENEFCNNIKITDINENTKNAFIAIEDKKFYKHNGINVKRILGATISNLKNKKIKEGASTITQQLVKNKFLSSERTIKRKIQEAYISLKLEKNYSKDEILESYLNTIYFGNGAYGIRNASKKFFNKEPIDLTLSESCVLAGCINSPTYYSPINNISNSLNRRNLILKEMLKDKCISQLDYENAINEAIIISDKNIDNNNLYLEFALDETSKILNKEKNEILSQGYKIYTYLNNEKQDILKSTVHNVNFYEANSYGNIPDSLAIMIDNNNYSVEAVAGKSIYNLVNFKRQPGSLIKPIFTYAPALQEKIIYPISQINDDKINIKGYSPNNVGNKFYGYTTINDCVAKSLNIPAIKLTEKLGIDKCKNYASKCGIEFNENDNNYSLALGGMNEGVTLKSIVDSYSVFTNNGYYTKSAFIDKIYNKDNVLVYNRNMSRMQVFDEDTAYLMTKTLNYSVKNGTSNKLNALPYDIAGKTGTVNVKNSHLNTDAYSLAYTTKDTICVWFGNYSMDNSYYLNSSTNGGTYCTDVIRNVFEEIYKDNYPTNFKKPESIITCKIDAKKLNEDHVVALANNTPERYVIEEEFSKNNIPDILSDKFINNEIFDFDISITGSKIKIKFNCKDYCEYKILKNNECIFNLKNHIGEYEYIDNDIQDNNKYKYDIICKNKYSNKELIQTKNIYYQNDFNRYISSNDFSFIFR